MSGEGPYRVGQEVEVSYRARVAEVVAGSAEGMPPLLRLEAVESGDYSTPPGGWLSPARVSVKVIEQPMPTEPGMYYMLDDDPKQAGMEQYHTDGYEFHYLNHEGFWVDIGFGAPSKDDAPKLKGPLVNKETA